MIAEEFKLTVVLAGIVFSALAQICMKQATTLPGRDIIWLLFISGSVFSYFCSFVAYYMALKFFAISRISPVMTVGVVILVVLYGVYSGETISGKQGVGMLLGLVSLLLILS